MSARYPEPTAALGSGFGGDVHSRMHGRELFKGENVMAYGAVGDGIADDTQAIQEAMAAAGNGEVFFPQGTFNYSETLLPVSGSSLVGAGQMRYADEDTGTNLHYTGSTAAITFSEVERCVVENIRVSTTTSATTILNFVDYSNSHTIRRVSLTGGDEAGPTAIKMSGQTSCCCHNLFEQVLASQVGAGVVLSGYANANEFNQCSFLSMDGYAISLMATGTDTIGGSDNLFIRCEIDGNTFGGIRMSDSALRNNFIKVSMDGVTDVGMDVDSTSHDNLFLALIVGPTLSDDGQNVYLASIFNDGSFNRIPLKLGVAGADSAVHFTNATTGNGDADGTYVGTHNITDFAILNYEQSPISFLTGGNEYARLRYGGQFDTTGPIYFGTPGGTGGATVRSGSGSPEAAVTANVGSVFLRTDGGAATTLYIKESGTATNTGWIAFKTAP